MHRSHTRTNAASATVCALVQLPSKAPAPFICSHAESAVMMPRPVSNPPNPLTPQHITLVGLSHARIKA
eukprot:2061033-Prymnesium_polylepis.1